jgi:murein L,D-transpeptidase YafK
MRALRSGLAGIAICAAAALAWANYPASALPPGTRADRLVIEKSRHWLALMAGGRELRSYAVSLGSAAGPKHREGVRRTPEGSCHIDAHNEHSGFHRAPHLSYPSLRDVARARAEGLAPGGAIMIHGAGNGFGWIGRAHRFVDWTAGCIALTNAEVEEIYDAVPDGTRSTSRRKGRPAPRL